MPHPGAFRTAFTAPFTLTPGRAVVITDHGLSIIDL